jgi:hypothetical protein
MDNNTCGIRDCSRLHYRRQDLIYFTTYCNPPYTLPSLTHTFLGYKMISTVNSILRDVIVSYVTSVVFFAMLHYASLSYAGAHNTVATIAPITD